MGVIAVVAAGVMFMIWRINPREDGPRLWFLASVVAIFAFGMVFLKSAIGSYAVFLNNTIVLVALLLILEGILRFREVGDRNKRRPWFLALVAFFALVSFINKDDPARRYLVYDLLAVSLSGASAYFLAAKARGLERMVNWVTASFFLVSAAAMSWRWLLAASGRIEPDIENNPVLGLVFLSTILWSLGWTYGLGVAVNLKARRQIDRLVKQDNLTGLYNRNAFDEEFGTAAARTRRDRSGFGLAMMDLNGFKNLNDTQGHIFGDHTLKAFADLLSVNLRESDSAFRIGGDEFVVLLDGIASPGELDGAINRFKAELNREIGVQGRRVRLAISIGGALCPDDGWEADQLILAADRRMYTDKKANPLKSLVVA